MGTGATACRGVCSDPGGGTTERDGPGRHVTVHMYMRRDAVARGTVVSNCPFAIHIKFQFVKK